jgi:hypothetical protein
MTSNDRRYRALGNRQGTEFPGSRYQVPQGLPDLSAGIYPGATGLNRYRLNLSVWTGSIVIRLIKPKRLLSHLRDRALGNRQGTEFPGSRYQVPEGLSDLSAGIYPGATGLNRYRLNLSVWTGSIVIRLIQPERLLSHLSDRALGNRQGIEFPGSRYQVPEGLLDLSAGIHSGATGLGFVMELHPGATRPDERVSATPLDAPLRPGSGQASIHCFEALGMRPASCGLANPSAT